MRSPYVYIGRNMHTVWMRDFGGRGKFVQRLWLSFIVVRAIMTTIWKRYWRIYSDSP